MTARERRRGSYAVTLAVLALVMMMLTALFSEYMRLHALRNRVETEIERAANIAVESAMHLGERQDHEATLISREDARKYFVNYLRNDLGLSGMGEFLTQEGELIYRLEGMKLDISEDPPRLAFGCTVRIPSMFSFFTTDALIPLEVISREQRTEEPPE
jgi:hypothetical protein